MPQPGDPVRRTGKKRRINLPNGRLATVKLTDDRDYTARLDVSLGDRRWVFGVRQDDSAEYLAGYENGERTALDCPDWLDHVAEKTGLEGFDA